MKILNQYIGATLLKSIALVLLVFLGLESFILLASQLGAIGKGSYTFWQALIYVILILPQETYQLFPVIGLLGALFGLSLLSRYSELVIMRTCGVSPIQILRAVLMVSVICAIFMGILGEGVGPAAKTLAEKRKLMAMSTEQALKTPKGIWLKQKQNFYYIQMIYSKHHIGNIIKYEFNQGKLLSVSVAEAGYYRHHDQSFHQNNPDVWQMVGIKKSLIFDKKILTQQFQEENWNLAIDPQLLSISQTSPESMSLKQLSNFITYQQINHLADSSNKIVYWQRIFLPIVSILMMLLALPFVFGPLRSVAMSLRLVFGVLLGAVFYLFNQLFPPLSLIWNLPPLFAVLLPILAFGLVGVLLMSRV